MGKDELAVNAPERPSKEAPLTAEHSGQVARSRASAPRERTPAEYRRLLDEALLDRTPYPSARFSGRGIVLGAGGPKYFPCAWVTLNILRYLGVTLPIELWYLGPSELDDAMKALLEPLNVRCVDALAVRAQHPVERLNGWELKPFSILHSAFEDVLLLDADNVPAKDPSFLFDAPEYRRAGAVFWPDRWRKPGDPHQHLGAQAWEVCGLSGPPGCECESGQLLVNKRAAWRALRVSMHLNEHSAYYYRFFYGDKDTYRAAFELCGTPYAMPETPVRTTPSAEVFYQHDFDGNVLFQHRLVKWTLTGKNFRDPRFEHEARCLEYLRELRQRLSRPVQRSAARTPRAQRVVDAPVLAPARSRPEAPAPSGSVAARLAALRFFEYHRVGYDRRILELRADGSVGRGRARLELGWSVDESDPAAPALLLFGEEGVICRLLPASDGSLRGRWLRFEKMLIVLAPRPAFSTRSSP